MPLPPTPGGLPRLADMAALVSTERFRAMERFSDAFLGVNRRVLARYAARWVGDPLHQWSRRWEYPFAEDALAPVGLLRAPFVLDAGSGATFFPCYMAEQLRSARILCADADASICDLAASLESPHRGRIAFVSAELERLPIEDGVVDAIACISVLEHCEAPRCVVEEFARVLAPGGTAR